MRFLTKSRAIVAASVVVLAFTAGALLQSGPEPVQAQPAKRDLPHPSSALLDPADTAILLLDHQAGLFQTVKDVPVAELRMNTVILAKLAKLAKMPLITTASVPDGPNGPLMHELAEVAPDATYVPRKGEISAWDNDDFVRKIGRAHV